MSSTQSTIDTLIEESQRISEEIKESYNKIQKIV